MVCDEITRSCELCQLYKSNHSKYSLVEGGLSSDKLFDFIASDIVGPYNTQDFLCEEFKEKFYIVTFIDIFSRWTEVDILFNIRSSDIINSFQNKWISKNGKPRHFHTDQGRQYISQTFGNFCLAENILHTKSSTYNPTSNSYAERINQQISNVLKNNKHSPLFSLKC